MSINEKCMNNIMLMVTIVLSVGALLETLFGLQFGYTFWRAIRNPLTYASILGIILYIYLNSIKT